MLGIWMEGLDLAKSERLSLGVCVSMLGVCVSMLEVCVSKCLLRTFAKLVDMMMFRWCQKQIGDWVAKANLISWCSLMEKVSLTEKYEMQRQAFIITPDSTVSSSAVSPTISGAWPHIILLITCGHALSACCTSTTVKQCISETAWALHTL